MTILLDTLSDPTRRMILVLIAQEKELCVCELVAALDDIQPKVSRQLSILRETGWLVSRKEGTWVFYRLGSLPKWTSQVLQGLIDGGVPENEQRAALKRLKGFKGRPSCQQRACA